MTDKTEWLAWARGRLDTGGAGVELWTGEWLGRSHSPSNVESGQSRQLFLASSSSGATGWGGGGSLWSPLISTVGHWLESGLTGPSSYQNPSWEEVFCCMSCVGLACDWEQTPALYTTVP